MVTYLKAVSFGSVSLIPFTAPARFFISSPARVVEVRSVMVGWFVRIVCHQICGAYYTKSGFIYNVLENWQIQQEKK